MLIIEEKFIYKLEQRMQEITIGITAAGKNLHWEMLQSILETVRKKLFE